jgi:hypothetical protein
VAWHRWTCTQVQAALGHGCSLTVACCCGEQHTHTHTHTHTHKYTPTERERERVRAAGARRVLHRMKSSMHCGMHWEMRPPAQWRWGRARSCRAAACPAGARPPARGAPCESGRGRPRVSRSAAPQTRAPASWTLRRCGLPPAHPAPATAPRVISSTIPRCGFSADAPQSLLRRSRLTEAINCDVCTDMGITS